MSRVALYSPYIPKHKGGGEKYLLSIAEVASQLYPTTLLVPSELVVETRESLPQYGEIFGLDLSRVEVSASPLGSSRGPLRTAIASGRFSHLFAMTDGSVFPSFAGKSYFIVQVPWTRKLSLPEKIKLNTWNRVLVYDKFVEEVVSRSWAPKSISVLSPYVDLDAFKPGEKEPIILNVGRFFRHTTSNSKRQDVCIEAFKLLVDKEKLPGYSLVLAGNIDPNPDTDKYIEELKTAAYGYAVNILTDLSFSQLRTYYGRSRFYWHAAGFGVDPKLNPENTEHFGITTLEAMASGCIPLVVPYGGQKEIVDDPHLFWESEQELYEKMTVLMGMKKRELSDLEDSLKTKAGKYSKDKFVSEVQKLLK